MWTLRLAAAAAGFAAVSATAAPGRQTSQERVAAEWVQDELRPFSGEAEFRRYMRDVTLAARSRDHWWALTERQRDGMIIVTGSRVQRRNASITNVQEPGVDEGDVVKQIDDYLIVLQDGRLFSIDTNGGGDRSLALADRIDVYRRPPTAAEREEGPDWYDEILVEDDRILVVGFSYARDVSEISVFRLTEDGRFEREGAFEIDSDDYYNPRNYATRLIGDDLLIYTPLDLARTPEQRAGLPTVRRVEPGDAGRGSARRLLDYRNLYGPLALTLEPTLHSVSVCPLGRSTAGRELNCRTRGFVGPGPASFYVSPTYVYFWAGPDDRWIDSSTQDCPRGHRASADDVGRAFVYRIPVGVGDPEAIAVRGEPVDQFSFDEEGGALRAFVRWTPQNCLADGDDPQHVSYVSLPLSRFSRFAADAPASSYVALPPTGDRDLANRFTSTHLAYAPLHEMDYDVDGDGDRVYESARPAASELVVVPLARPAEARTLRLDHNVRRLEVLGNGLLVGGTSTSPDRAAALSLVDVAGAPRIDSTLRLPGVSAGEGRSHAFNLLLNADGSGIFGLPTIAETEETLRRDEDFAWSLPSDLSFFSIDAGGRMRSIGLLASAMPRRRYHLDEQEEAMLDGEPDEDIVAGYSCLVSCVDWYGNSRPIFTDGRIFALSATELIEGRLDNGRVVEVRRLDFARAVPRR